MVEEIDTYEPEITKQEELDVDASDDFADISDGKLIRTRLNENVIIQRIAKDLYSSPVSGLRELYANAVRACKRAVEEGMKDEAKITIHIDEDSRRLILQDNGIGISKERFKKVLLELGTSDNHDAGTAGQFGMGFASYTTLSSTLILETRTKKDNYKMIARDGLSFQHVGKCDELAHTGTRLEMILYKDMDVNSLIAALPNLCTFSGVRTEISGRTSGLYEPMEIEDYIWYQKHAREKVIHIENEDFDLWALIGDENRYMAIDKIRLATVPIKSEISLPFRRFILNIKDERKYKPMPNRDYMTREADEKLQSIVDTALTDYFSNIQIEGYEDTVKSERRKEFIWLCNNPEYAPDDKREFWGRVGNVMCRLLDGEEYGRYERFTSLLNWHSEVCLLRSKNIGQIRKIKEMNPDIRCFIIPARARDRVNREMNIKALEDFGVWTPRTLLGREKSEEGEDKSEYLAHIYGDTGYETYSVTKEDLDNTYIMVDNVPMTNVIQYVRHIQSDYGFIKRDKKLNDSSCQKYSVWLRDVVPGMFVRTNRGSMSIKDMVDTKHDIVFLKDYEEWQDTYLKKEKTIYCYDYRLRLPVLLYMNPRAEQKPDTVFFSPAKDAATTFFNGVISEKYNVRIMEDNKLRAFVENMDEIPERHHWETIVGLSELSYYSTGIDEVIDYAKKKNVSFDKDDLIDSLRYYTKEMKNAQRPLWRDSYNLCQRHIYHKIRVNDALFMRLFKEHTIPTLFGIVSKVLVRGGDNESIHYNQIFILEFNFLSDTIEIPSDISIYPEKWQVDSSEIDCVQRKVRMVISEK